MSQLQAVLRRSVSHLDPEDDEARKRVFASARAAMVRLLFSYEPPLSTGEINRKIGEFDRIVSEIEQGMDPVEEASGIAAAAEARRLEARTRLTRPPLARFTSREPIEPANDVEPEPSPSARAWSGRSERSSRERYEPEARYQPGQWDEPRREPEDGDESKRGNEPRDRYDPDERYEAEPADEETSDYDRDPPVRYDDGHDDDRRDDDRRDDDYGYEDDEPYRLSRTERLMEWARSISGRTVAIAAAAVVLLIVILWGAGLFYSFLAGGRGESARANDARPAAVAAAPAAPSSTAPQPPRSVTTTSERLSPEPPLPTGALALETLVLFDGRDPTVFQSAPDNPVRFEGDADGGFVRVASSTVSTGTRLVIGRGVFERIAGRAIRIVVVGRGNKQAPAHGLRFAYQNGRTLSPWIDVALSEGYAPLSGIWTVPKSRGGPESDALIIEPGIPGDGTAADIKSVRLEVLS